MKKWFLLAAFCVCHLFSLPIQDHSINPIALSQLTHFFEIPDDADLVFETQKWLRKPGQERWEISELSSNQRDFVLNWAEKQGLFSSWKPLDQTYDQALILGATTSRMQLRLEYLKQLWNEGVRFEKIVFLTGDRPLDKRVDSLTERCNTESEAARILWEEASLPESMRNLPVVFVAAPMKGNQRPNTEETLLVWLQSTLMPCKALFISNQPFCGYQFSVIKKVLPDAFQFDLVGPGIESVNHPAMAAVTLDTIARWIYQEKM